MAYILDNGKDITTAVDSDFNFIDFKIQSNTKYGAIQLTDEDTGIKRTVWVKLGIVKTNVPTFYLHYRNNRMQGVSNIDTIFNTEQLPNGTIDKDFTIRDPKEIVVEFSGPTTTGSNGCANIGGPKTTIVWEDDTTSTNAEYVNYESYVASPSSCVFNFKNSKQLKACSSVGTYGTGNEFHKLFKTGVSYAYWTNSGVSKWNFWIEETTTKIKALKLSLGEWTSYAGYYISKAVIKDVTNNRIIYETPSMGSHAANRSTVYNIPDTPGILLISFEY